MLEHGTREAVEDADGERARRRATGSRPTGASGAEIARSFAPELVITDFDGFAYLYAKRTACRCSRVDNIQMVDRCSHDAEILRGIHRDYRAARAFVHAKLGAGRATT